MDFYEYAAHVLNSMHLLCIAPCWIDTHLASSNLSLEYDLNSKFQIVESAWLLQIVGYIVSLISTVFTIFILLCLKSKLNKKVEIDLYLFLFLLIETSIPLIFYLYQKINSIYGDLDLNHGIDNPSIVCESLYVLQEISTSCTFIWFLLEGLYLHFLTWKSKLYCNYDTNKYICFGWTTPGLLIITLTGVICYFYTTNKMNLCWFGLSWSFIYWYLQSPRLLIILFNIFVLIRVLMTVLAKMQKLRLNTRIRKGVRVLLLLLPLLGITNILGTFNIPLETSVWTFLIWYYVRQFMHTFQGLFLSLACCFCNDDVHVLLKQRLAILSTLKEELLFNRKNKRVAPKEEDIPLQTREITGEIQNEPQPVGNNPSTSGINFETTVMIHEPPKEKSSSPGEIENRPETDGNEPGPSGIREIENRPETDGNEPGPSGISNQATAVVDEASPKALPISPTEAIPPNKETDFELTALGLDSHKEIKKGTLTFEETFLLDVIIK